MRRKQTSKKERHLIIPVFLPFGGCPHLCVFCNQTSITGIADLPSIDEVTRTIEAHLSTWQAKGRSEIAFYGGSFTGLARETQEQYLECAFRFVEQGRVDGLRISTRPDTVERAGVELLKRYGVETVELGAQSFDPDVLALSGRGHGVDDTRRAVKVLKESGVKVGLQLMPGLPGDTVETILRTGMSAVALMPDFVRIYPTLVIRGTPLHDMFERGEYAPWTLEAMVSVCCDLMEIFKDAGVRVIRVGLQPTEELTQSLVAGPFHPSFRELVHGKQKAGEGRRFVE